MRAFWVILLLLCTLMMSGCELIGDIFQAGMWVGVILVLLIRPSGLLGKSVVEKV